MISILVVDDDTAKLKNIVQCLMSVDGIRIEDIDEARDGATARNRLRINKYNLLIIDVALPDRFDQETSARGGLELLEQVSDEVDYIKPDHIIGLTAYSELVQESQQSFMEKDWNVYHYDSSSERWCHQLKAKATHLVSANRNVSAGHTRYECDLAIVCAVPSIELRAVRDLPWDWDAVLEPLDHTTYFRGNYEARGASRIVYAAAPPRVGMAAAAALAMKMACRFRPRYIVMTGIAAGFKGATSYGDIIVSDQCWDYGSGKHDIAEGVQRFRAAPVPLSLDPGLRSSFERMAEDHVWLSSVWSDWRGVRPSEMLRMRVGPMASGAAVLADITKSQGVLEQNRKVLALEMEAYGVLSAVEQSPLPRPQGAIIKSVCDFADADKDDRFQSYAAFTSARALQRFAESFT